MQQLQFEKEYKVYVSETGPDGKLNLYSLFNYLQDIASDHAVRLGFGKDDLMRYNHFWVLSRIYAVINELPSWEETIIIKTWPNGTDKLFALRNYEVRYRDGRVIASGSSSWLILDRSNRKVQRPDSILTQLNPDILLDRLQIRSAAKIEPAAEDGRISTPFRVKVSDIDVNLHTNNVQYLKWVTDSYSLNFITKNVPRSVEINYLAESLYDQEIIIRTSPGNEMGTIFNHSVIRLNDSKEICRIRIEWRKE